jgi:RHS repeat-associated protein
VVRREVDGLNPVDFTYDARGRLTTVTQGIGSGARASSLTYNPEGYLETLTDPLARTVRFAYDLAGRVVTQTLPDLREIHTRYDANGNVASITPPARPPHLFDYTPLDLEAVYTPPDLGMGEVATSYTYSPDRQLTLVTRPDGQTVSFSYDPSKGRLVSLTEPRGLTTLTYHPSTGKIASIASPDGVTLGYTYDGSLLTGATWTGPVAGSVTWTYDTDFRIATERVNGGDAIALQYDPDSLLAQAGSLTLTWHPQHGLLTGTALGSVEDGYTYTSFGEQDTYQARYAGAPIWDLVYSRDALGRITQRVETIEGARTTTVYGYDVAGRLSDVTVDGILTAHYEYDGNGNRLGVTRPGTGTVTGSYDAQDRLLTYGGVSYTYSGNGDLQTATSGSQTTTYTYDVFGSLIAVSLPTGTQIEYLTDGQHRRIGKKVNGALVQAFLYSSQLRPAAELDGSGGVVARFVYGTRINVPEYMVKAGTTYRLLTDHLGSVRLVLDTATGAVVQRLDYDEFGQVLLDTNPGFQPFAFAGGLYDPDTNLIRFGARDYDPFTGRWTAKDPMRFTPGLNLYAYGLNDPSSFQDPFGLRDFPLGHTWGDVASVLTTSADLGLALGTAALGRLPTNGTVATAVAVGSIADVSGLTVALGAPVIGSSSDILGLGLGAIGAGAAVISGSVASVVVSGLGVGITAGILIDKNILDSRSLFPKGNPVERFFCSALFGCDVLSSGLVDRSRRSACHPR